VTPLRFSSRLATWGRRPDIRVTAALLALAAGVRIGFWCATELTLEDALISARYAHNIAQGNGFVYNLGEWVLGTTTPLWTLILAALEIIGFRDPISAGKALGILLDCASLTMLLSLFPRASHTSRLLFGILFAASPTIVPITVSAMETPLLIFSMALTLAGMERRHSYFGVGLALTLLTRIDGAIFVLVMGGASMLRHRRWAIRQLAIAALLCVPWFTFAFVTYGSVVPQSVVAKSGVYDLGVGRSAASMLGHFLPLGEDDPLRYIVKSVLTLLGVVAFGVVALRAQRFLPLGLFFVLYITAFSLSGGLIFSWYLVPPVIMLYVTMALAASATLSLLPPSAGRWRMLIGGIVLTLGVAHHGVLLPPRFEKYAELQSFEDALRRPIGLWLRERTAPRATVFLEPIGYIGYYAGIERRIVDEIGLVAPEITDIRGEGPGWYTRALRRVAPDYLVQYRAALEENASEGTGDPLFKNREEELVFRSQYSPVAEFDVTDRFPGVSTREKAYVILRRTGQ